MKGQIRRILSLVLAIVMVLSIVPVSAEDSNVVVDETNTVETNPAAQIGDVEYLTLTDAFEAAQTGQTIKLLRDVDEVVRLSVSTGTEVKSITLNLNGKTWDCGYGTRINAVDLKVTNGTIGTKRSVALEAGDSIDVFYFGGHGMLPSKMDLKGVTFNAELRVNNMAPSEEELELLATTKSVGKAFNATEVTIWDSQYDVVTVQKAAYLTINGGWFSGINAEDGAFVTDNRNKGESSDDSETTEDTTEVAEVKLVTILSTTGTRTERGVTVTFVDSTPVETSEYMQFTLGESSTVFTVQRLDGETWTTVSPESGTSTIKQPFTEPGTVTFRVDWDGNGTYDRLVVLVKAPVAKVGDKYYTSIDEAVAAWTDGTTLTILTDATVNLGSPLALLSDEITLKDSITAADGNSALVIESGNVVLNVNSDITLTGGKGGAGIYVAEGASLTIKGSGTLTAIGNGGVDTADSGAAGIGGTYANGNSGAITIDGATVVAKGYGKHGSGIGSGSGKVVGEIKIINGANVTAYGGYYADGAGTLLQSSYGKSDPEGGAAIGGGGKTASTIADITIADSTVVAYGGSKAAGIGANFWSSCGIITIEGNSNVTAQGGSSSAGIGTSRAGDTGVTANIVISGGTVTATGGAYGAGIGGGYNADSLGNGADASALPEISVTISGGTVTAQGGEGGAGVGGGYKTDNVNIDITGGTVTAQAGALVSGKTIDEGGEACAIGSGANGSGVFENSPDVTIADTATVTAYTLNGGKPAIEGDTDENWDALDNVTIIKPWYDPDATEYIIMNADEMLEFAETVAADVNFEGKVVKLGDTIDLSGIEWSPIGGDSVYFAGEFDGQGYAIKNLTQTTGARMGLFGLVEKAYIHDLTLENVSFTVAADNARVGAIAGNLQYWNVIENVTIDGINITVNGNDGLIGAVAGYVWKSQLGNVDVKNAVITVNGTGNVIGGNTGYGRAHVWDTGVTGNNAHWLEGTVQNINGTEYVLQNYYEGCDVSGITINLNGSGNEAGGFFGSDTYNSQSNYFVNCHVSGLAVTAAAGTSQTVGGFIAWNNGTTSAGTVKGFNGCSVAGTIKGANGIYGGFVGQVGGRACEYNNASANVNITSSGTAGGFVGITQAYSTHKYTFSKCTATGNVSGAIAGGFTGKNGLGGDGKSVYVEYNNCSASGAVKGSTYAGGLIGYVNTELPATNWNIVDSTGSLILTGNTAAANVTGDSVVGYLIGYLDGVANGDAKEGNTLKVDLTDNTPDGSDIGTGTGHHINISGDTVVDDITVYVAQVGDTKYETLAEAVAAANAVVDAEGNVAPATVELLADVTLGEKLTITGNVTIKGAYTITRDDAYTGTLFAVNAGAALTLDGGLTIDGGNNYTFDSAAYEADLAGQVNVAEADCAKWFTPEEGAPVATAFMITTSGTVNLNKVTIQNNYSTGSGVVQTSGTNVKVNLNGAKITHIASTGGNGVAVQSSGEGNEINMYEGTVIDGNHVGGNHGIFKVYSGTVFNMYGGEIKNTTGWNSNGVAIGMWWAGGVNMYGGTICSNSSVYGPSNGRNAAVYVHNGSAFTMSGGTICHNTGAYGGLDMRDTTSNSATITGGSIVNNNSVSGSAYYDVKGNAQTTISGGTFTQDVTQWLAPDHGLIYDEEKGTYTVTTDIAEVNGVVYKSIAAAVEAANVGDTVKVLASHKLGQSVNNKGKNITLDLNGQTISSAGDAIVVERGTLTINGEGEVKGGTSGVGSWTAVWANGGDVIINGGTYSVGGDSEAADTTHQNDVIYTKNGGTVTINGGTFLNDGNVWTLNENDSNRGTITVKGGTFHNWNPADNVSEGEGTDFVAEGFVAIDNDDNIWTVYPADYYISNAEELLAFRDSINNGNTFKGINVHLTADIDMTGIAWDVATEEFSGVFDGHYYTIKNLAEEDYSGAGGRMGLFAHVENGTVKNLTIDGAKFYGYGPYGGIVAGSAYGDCVFENITLKNCEIEMYNTGSAGIVGLGYAESNYTFKNINIDASNTIGSIWGSWDTPSGGLIGYYWNRGTMGIIDVSDSYIAPVINVYNDVCANYQWYAYRYAGMLVGYVQTTEKIDGTTYPVLSNLKCSNVTVEYGTWMLYRYCEWEKNSMASYSEDYQFSREDNMAAMRTHEHTEEENNHNVLLPFDQLYGGGQGVYGKQEHLGVTVIYPKKVAAIGETEYYYLQDAVDAASEGDTVTVIADHAVGVTVVIEKNVTLDLNGKTVTSAGDVFEVVSGGTLTINDSSVEGTGTVKGGTSGVGSWTAVWANGGNVVINGGTYSVGGDKNATDKTHQNDVIYTKNGGTVTINGGTFLNDGNVWTLNENDANRETITVYGGTFHNWNPEDNVSEGEGTNFCAPGYVATANADETVWTVAEWNGEIWNKEDLYRFSKMAQAFAANDEDPFAGKTVKLMADVDAEWADWYPINFYGTFEGNNHTISNLTYIPRDDGRMGFFQLAAGPVSDLTLDGIKGTVPAGGRFGGFARYLNAVATNVHIKNIEVTTTDTKAWVGGFTTYTAGGRTVDCTVENLFVDASAGADLIAGFAALTSNRQVYSNSDVKGFKVIVTDTDSSGCGVGGWAGQTQTGWNNPKFENCDVTGIDITATGLVDVGGFIAWPGAHTEYANNCTTQGKIDVTGVTSSGCFAGGFFGNLGWNCDLGYMGHVVNNCSANVDITTKVASAGGFVGSATNSNNRSMYATFNSCSASGNITAVAGGTANIGGFAGEADRGVYNNCSANGTVTNNGTGVDGGFIGEILDTNPKYDGRYPAGTRDYLVNEITFDNSKAACEPFVGFVTETRLADDLTNVNSYVAKVGDSLYATFDAALAAAKASEEKTVEILAPVVLTTDKDYDLADVTVTNNGDVYPLFRIQNDANVTFKGGNVSNSDYVFVLGASDGSSAGNLTINGGTYTGVTTVASVTKGTLTITGGEFKVADGEYGATYLLNCIDANYKDGSAKIVVTGGTYYGFNPEANAAEGAETNFVAEGYIAEQIEGTENDWLVRKANYIAQVGDVKYESLQEAINACTAGETVKLIANVIYTSDDVVYAHGGGTGFGKYDASNPSIIYTGGTNVDGVISPSTVNAVLDLNGHTITNNADAYMFMIMDNAKLTFKDSVGTGSITNNAAAPVIWAVGTETLVKIESGKYVTANNEGLLWSTHGADMVIDGGNFSTTADDASMLIVRSEKDRNNAAHFVDGNATITIYGGTYNYNPEKTYDDSTKPYTEFNAVADGYIARQTDVNTWVVGAGEWVAQVGEKLYEDFFTALEDAKVAEDKTVILLKSIELTEDKEIDLDGVTVKVDENLSAKPAFRVLANVTVKNGTVDATDGTSTYAFIVGNSATAGTLTIADGTYKGDVSAISITNGTANISGGTFEATEYNGAHEFTLNCIDSAYNNGTAVYNITGGKFYKFNPENNAAEGANTNFLTEKYTAVQNGDYYEVMDYVTWVKEQLLAGNSVTLDRDVKITDYSYVNALELPSNGNGKYTEVHGNGAVFHVIKPGVVFDLNGHTLTWDAHDDAYCNKRQVSLFMVTITGNAGETSSLTIKNSVEGEGKVNVYGMGTGVYVVGVDAKATITGGTWTNYPCSNSACGASNIFMYPSHGGEMYITGGAFNQVGGEYLLGWKGSTKTTANNGVGTDFDATKLAITGGKYIGFNPELTKFFDIANSGQETINGVAEGYIARETEPNVWVVGKGEWVAQIGDVKYASVQEAVNAALAGETVKLIADVAITETINVADDDEIVLDLNGHKLTNVIPAEATVFHTIENSGKLTVIDSVGGGEIQSNSAKGYVIYTECGSLVVDGAKITGINNGYAIVTWTAGDSVTIEEGTVIEGRGALYVDGGATGTVNGGTFTMTVQTTNNQDNVVYVGGASELTINGGTFTTGDITGAQRVAVTALGSANVTINGGSFYGTTDDLVTDNSATISVTNGTFTGTQLREKKDTSTISLTGGTYSYDPAEWVAEGYIAVCNGAEADTWTVRKANYVVQITDAAGDVIAKYETLEEAAAAVQSGETIVLLTDSDVSFEVNGNIGLDVNGTNYTGTITLTDAAATLTADEGLNVTTNLDGYAVVYKEGVYKVEPVITVMGIEDAYAAEIQLWLYVDIPDVILEDANAYVLITKNSVDGGTTKLTVAQLEQCKQGSGYYLLSQGIASGEMTATVDYEFYNGEGVAYQLVTASGKELGTKATYSILDYVKMVLTYGSDAQKDIVTYLVTYGGYAQKHFDVDAENPAYNVLAQYGIAVPDISAVTAETITNKNVVEGSAIGISAAGTEAYLDSEIYLRVYFKLDEGQTIDNFTFTLDSKTLTPGIKNGLNYVDIRDIAAAYVDREYKVVVTNNTTGETYSLTTSVLAWVRNILLYSNDEAQKNMARALYLYNQAANRFFGK